MKKVLLAALLLVSISCGLFFFINNRKVEIYIPNNEDSYSAVFHDKCTIYYPNNNDVLEDVESLCDIDNEKKIIDYTKTINGDMVIITYDEDHEYYLNSRYQKFKVNDIDKEILSSELRYHMKKEGIDDAYTTKFLKETYTDNIDINDFEFEFDKDELICTYLKYDFTFTIPYEYIQKSLGYNFNVEDKEYEIRRYIDPNRKIVALTFDDGPYYTVDIELQELSKIYDSPFTYFIVGNRIGNTNAELIKEGIKYNNEYGSHTYDHANLNKLSVSDAIKAIKSVEDILNTYFDFDMDIYRPSYGNHSKELDDNCEYIAILWNVDSLDWKYRDEDLDYKQIMNTVSDKDVILMHDLYIPSMNAAKRVVPDLIDQGYQFVTISEMLDILDLKDIKVFSGR